MEGARNNTIQFLSTKTDGEGTVAKIGTYEVIIKKSTVQNIQTVWIRQTGNSQTGTFELINDSLKQITTVYWYFDQHIKWYPWERFGSMMNDKLLGPTMEKSLNNLKQLAEKK